MNTRSSHSKCLISAINLNCQIPRTGGIHPPEKETPCFLFFSLVSVQISRPLILTESIRRVLDRIIRLDRLSSKRILVIEILVKVTVREYVPRALLYSRRFEDYVKCIIYQLLSHDV